MNTNLCIFIFIFIPILILLNCIIKSNAKTDNIQNIIHDKFSNYNLFLSILMYYIHVWGNKSLSLHPKIFSGNSHLYQSIPNDRLIPQKHEYIQYHKLQNEIYWIYPNYKAGIHLYQNRMNLIYIKLQSECKTNLFLFSFYLCTL